MGVPTSRCRARERSGRPDTNLQFTLVPAEADEFVAGIETITGFSDAQGRFTISGVPPGQYTLRAVRAPRPTGMMEEECAAAP